MQFSLFDAAPNGLLSNHQNGASAEALLPVYRGSHGERFFEESPNHDALNAQARAIDLTGGQLHFLPQWLASDAADHLKDHLASELAWQQSVIQLYGQSRKIPRLNAWYGDAQANYQYSGLKLKPLTWTSALLQLRAAIEQTLYQLGFKGVRPLNSVLANLYRDERDSVAWHSDDEPQLGRQPLIASVSLGAVRRFSLRHKRIKGERYELLLPSGSLLIMFGDTQQNWQHALLKQTQKCEPRINLTFRHIV